jgi:hypothetical protein
MVGLLIMGAIRLHEFINVQELIEYAKTTEDRLIEIKDDGEMRVKEEKEGIPSSVENIASLLAAVKNTDIMAKKVLHFDSKLTSEDFHMYYSSALEEKGPIKWKEEKAYDNVRDEKLLISEKLTNEWKSFQLDTNEFFDHFLLTEITEFDWTNHKNFLSFVSKMYLSKHAESSFYQDKDEIVAKLKKMSPEEYRDYMQNVHYLINGKRMFEDINLLKKVF